METQRSNLLRDAFLLLLALLLIVIFLQGCKTSRDVSVSKTETRTDQRIEEQSETNTETETETRTDILSETNIIEEFDTLVKVRIPYLPLPDSSVIDDDGYFSAMVPVKGKRTTQNKQYTQTQEKKKENASAVSGRKEANQSETDASDRDVKVERFSLPWWIWPILILLAAIGVLILLWRLKLFRFPF